MNWGTFWLILHILVAIVAFGPTFAFPLIGKLAEKEPAHGNFALRITDVISKRMTTPLAVVMPFLGVALIITRDWDLWRSEWLMISIPLYTVSFFFALFFEDRWVARLIEMTGGHPAGVPVRGAEPGVAPVSGAQMAPPPEMLALLKRVQLGGMFLSITFVAVLVLMVWKPGACFAGAAC